MKKTVFVALALHLAAAGIARADEKSTGDSPLVAAGLMNLGAGVGVGGGLLASAQYLKILEIYQRNSETIFAAKVDSGSLLSSHQIGDIVNSASQGDEIHITYRTAAGEEARIRLEQLEKRKARIDSEIAAIRAKLTNQGQNSQATHARLSLLLEKEMERDTLNDSMKSLRAAPELNTRSMTRVVDMNRHSTRDLEMFLIDKNAKGKKVLQVTRISRASRFELAQARRLFHGSMVVSILGATVLLEELTRSVLSDDKEELDIPVFAPAMVNGQ